MHNMKSFSYLCFFHNILLVTCEALTLALRFLGLHLNPHVKQIWKAILL